MKRVRLTILVAIGLALMLLVVQNTAPVQARFLWMSAEIPAVVLLFLTAVGGFVAGLLATLLVKRGSKPKQ
ncbi:MAG: LapA family protein [Syntrophotaleaceae bacterium]